MTRKGRDLEELVALLERAISQEESIKIESPEYIRGVASKSNREVDVTLRSKIGSTSVLVALEVRERESTEDVRWIEQLVTKRDDIQASRMVAVSAIGFSAGAVRMADQLGIDLRTLGEVKVDVVRSWFVPQHIEFQQQIGNLVHSEIIIVDDDFAGTKEEVTSLLTKLPIVQPRLVHVGTGAVVSVMDCWQEVLNQQPRLFESMNVGADPKRVTIVVRYPKKDMRYCLETEKGRLVVTQITFTADLMVTRVEVPIAKITEYSGADGAAIVQSVHFEIEAMGKRLDMGIHNLRAEGRVALTVRARTLEEKE